MDVCNDDGGVWRTVLSLFLVLWTSGLTCDRSEHRAVYFGSKFYVFGGRDTSSNPIGTLYSSSDGVTFSAVTMTGSAPAARYGHLMVVNDGKMYIGLGQGTSGAYLGDMYYTVGAGRGGFTQPDRECRWGHVLRPGGAGDHKLVLWGSVVRLELLGDGREHVFEYGCVSGEDYGVGVNCIW